MKAIASRENATFKALLRLVTNASARRKSGLSVLEGAHLVEALLDAGHAAEEVVVDAAAGDDPEVQELLQRAAPAKAIMLESGLFAALSTLESPARILATARTPPARPARPDTKAALLLEDIQDPGNVGMLLRSAAAAGVEHVLLSPTCAFAWSPKVLRAGMGAHFAVNVVERVDLLAWITAFAGQSVALTAGAERSLYDLDLERATAFLVGNEGAGLSAALVGASTHAARIPMPGRIESLNAAAAGTIAVFEMVRQRRWVGATS